MDLAHLECRRAREQLRAAGRHASSMLVSKWRPKDSRIAARGQGPWTDVRRGWRFVRAHQVARISAPGAIVGEWLGFGVHPERHGASQERSSEEPSGRLFAVQASQGQRSEAE